MESMTREEGIDALKSILDKWDKAMALAIAAGLSEQEAESMVGHFFDQDFEIVKRGQEARSPRPGKERMLWSASRHPGSNTT